MMLQSPANENRQKFTLLVLATVITSVTVVAAMSGCISESSREVVVYCALDREFSEPILNQFQEETGIRVLAKYDLESNKTVGLANLIIQQRQQPRCDVFWNNEILHTLRLKQAGLLRAHNSRLKSEYPAAFVSTESDWYGFAARARVFLVNTEKLPVRSQWPTSMDDLIDPKWQGNCAVAKPLFGTTATQAAVLYNEWGNDKARTYLEQVAKNAAIEGGNKQVAINVARGRYAFGLTDTDDAIVEIEQGNPVAIVFPDQGENQPGTLLIPNTISLIAGGPNPVQARKLIDFLLQQSVEDQLAAGRSAQIPLNLNSQVRSRVEPEQLKVMPVDFEAAAENWDEIKSQIQAIFPL